MSWFAVDDRFHQHRKVIKLRRSTFYAVAVSLWTLAGSWAAGDTQAQSIGRVPLDVVWSFAMPDTDGGIDALVSVGLWTCDGEFIEFHDWAFWNGPDAKTKRYQARLESDRVRQANRRSRSSKPASTEAPLDLSRDGHVNGGTGRDGPGRAGPGYNLLEKNNKRTDVPTTVRGPP